MSESPQSDDWFASLIARARTADGQPPFSDQSLVDLRTGARQLVTIDSVAASIVGAGEAEFVVDPDARDQGHGTRLLETLLSTSPGELLVWAHGDHPAARALAASHDLDPVRELLHLTATVTPRDRPRRELALTSFLPGRDEEPWVALNALIFAAHPEQGSVTVDDVLELEREPWFDPDDVLLLRDGDGAELVGYCWLKVEGERGEFYVVGVHPRLQGTGVGGALFDAGLARLAEHGIRSAHLYVEGDNEAALRLYRARGFEQDSIDVQYARRRLIAR
jgi:mycothiol synthase